jgi:KUP system potassium uptake protein
MMMTTLLMCFYFYVKRKSTFLILIFFSCYLLIEGSFLVANMFKFIHGGWVTLLIAGIIFSIMFIWFRGRSIKRKLTEYVNVESYYSMLNDMRKDESIQKYATNLVYFTYASSIHQIETKVMYSIFNKRPKRADVYWIIHVDVVDDPHTMTYKVTHLIPETLIRIDFKIGFKIQTRINLYFRKVIESMTINKEVDITSRYPSLRKYAIPGDFRFILTDRVQGYDFDFKPFDQFVMDVYYIIKKIGISDEEAYGLDTSSVMTEKIPLVVNPGKDFKINRITE